MVPITWVKLAPGDALAIASRVTVDTALAAVCTDIMPPPRVRLCACTCTDSICCTRLVSLDVVVFEVLEALARCALAAGTVPSCVAASWAQAEPAAIENTTAMAIDRWVLFTGIPGVRELNRQIK